MRLLLVSNEFPPSPGGIGTHAWEIAKNLHMRGWDVVVLTKQEYESEKAIQAFNDAQPFRVVTVKPLSLKPFKFLHWLRQTSELVRSWSPDVLLASGVSAVMVAAIVAKFRNQRLVVVAHGEFPRARYLPWMRWSYGKAKALICVSEYTKQQMRSVGIQPSLITVIPNGGNHLLFKPIPEQDIKDFKQNLGIGNAAVLLTVGKVSPRKGQNVVIRALPHILKKVPDTHYFMVGMPDSRNEFAALANKLSISKFVHFTGAVNSDALVRYLNSCDVFVMLSSHANREFEAYGISVIEAALCAKPSVVSADSGLKESVVPGKTGLTVPEGDELAAADAIVSLLQNEKLRMQLGHAARAIALQTATWESRAKSYDDLLHQVAAAYSHK